MERVSTDIRSEQKLSRFLSAVVFFLFLTNISAGLSEIVNGIVSAELISNLLKIFLGIMLIFRLPIIVRRFNKRMLAAVFGAILISLLNLLLFQENTSYFISCATTFFSMCFTTYFVASVITDFSELRRQLLKISYMVAIIVGVLLIWIFTGRISSFNNGTYSMGFGYACQVPTMCMILEAAKNRSITSLIGTAVLLVAIIAFGSRGPLLGILLFALFWSIRYLMRLRRYILCIIVVSAVILLFFCYKDLLLLLADVFETMGIQSRTIRLMTMDTVHTAGRDELYDALLPLIAEKPFAVRGINAEWNVIGIYAHNIVIELLYQGGLIVGGAAIIYILIKILKTLIVKEETDWSALCLMFLFASVPQLMVSSSLWICHGFWIWLAILGNSVYACKIVEAS